MIYHFTKSLISAALKGFFYKIHYIGKEDVDTSKPTIFIVNHPSALMDPLLVATALKKELHFIAAAEYFGHPIISWILRKELNMVPVYRPEIKGNEGTGNQDMFRECYNCLSDFGSLMIFPEGTSKTIYKLRELKTGTIRIWRGANEKLKERGIKVNIVPVGLHYSDPHTFQSEVIVKFGTPVNFDLLRYNTDWNEADQIRHETEWLHQSLKQQLVHLDNDLLQEDFRLLEKIYGFELLSDLAIGEHEAGRKLIVLQHLASALEYFHQLKGDRIRDLLEQLRILDKKMTDLKIFTPLLNKSGDKYLQMAFVFFLFPIHLLSVLFNGIPFLVSKWIIVRQIKPRIKKPEENRYGPGIQFHFSGTAIFSAGLLVFLVSYLIMAILIGYFVSFWWSIPSILMFYLLGRVSLKWMREFFWVRRYFFMFRLSKFSRSKYLNFKKEYLEILEELKRLKDDWQVIIRKGN